MVGVDETSWPWDGTLIEGGPKEWPVLAVCEILDKTVSTIFEERSCLCIPAFPAEDEWTKMLIRCLKTKDKTEESQTPLQKPWRST